MELTDEQRGVLYKSLHFLFNEEAIAYVISGVAGSGKSTIVRSLCDHIPPNLNVWIVAFTGRAISPYMSYSLAHNVNCSTLHGFLYECKLGINDEPIFFKKDIEKIREETDIIIIEESSMVNAEMFEQIEQIGVPMIFVGDKDQLPPISDDSFNIMEAYDYHLVTSKRNKDYLGQFINDYRDHKRFSPAGDGVTFLDKNTLTLNHFKNNDYDAVLVGTNRQKDKYNNLVRLARGFTGEFPKPGETVINLRNTILTGSPPVYVANGELLTIVRVVYEVSDQIMYEVKTEQGLTADLSIHKLIWDAPDEVPKEHKNRIDYGYAISVWKAQGSEFDRVLYVHNNVSWFVDQHKFTYTAISRAKKSLTIAK